MCIRCTVRRRDDFFFAGGSLVLAGSAGDAGDAGDAGLAGTTLAQLTLLHLELSLGSLPQLTSLLLERASCLDRWVQGSAWRTVPAEDSPALVVFLGPALHGGGSLSDAFVELQGAPGEDSTAETLAVDDELGRVTVAPLVLQLRKFAMHRSRCSLHFVVMHSSGR